MDVSDKASQGSTERRRAIIAAARRAFLKQGYGNTSMSAIAAAIGGSKTTLWSYFKNKNDLFDAVVDDLIDRYGEALRFPLPDDGDLRATLEAYAVSVLSTITRPQVVALHRIVTGEAARFPQLGTAMMDKAIRRGQGRLADWLAVQVAAGRIHAADPALASQQFGALCQGGAFQRHLIGAAPRPGADAIAREAAEATEMFLRAYARPAGAAA